MTAKCYSMSRKDLKSDRKLVRKHSFEELVVLSCLCLGEELFIVL